MTDYNKLTVVDLKVLLGERNIPQTGLKRKQQIVDRLVEDDAKNAAAVADQKNDTGPNTLEAEASNSEALQDEGAVQKAEDVAVTEENVREDSGTRTTNGGLGQDAEGVVTVNNDEQARDQDLALPQEDIVLRRNDTPGIKPQTTIPVELSKPSSPSSRTSAGGLSTSQTPVPSKELTTGTAPIALTTPTHSQLDTIMTASSTPLGVQERREDSLKRKRRSGTPTISAEEVFVKKLKQDEEEAVHLKEDFQGVGDAEKAMEGGRSLDVSASPEALVAGDYESMDVMIKSMEEDSKMGGDEPGRGDTLEGLEAATTVEKTQENIKTDDAQVHREDEAQSTDIRHISPRSDKREPTSPSFSARRQSQVARDGRYKDLFPKPTMNNDKPSRTSNAPAEENATTTTPSIHPATAAVYIRNLMRPLQAQALKSHLITLATPSSSSPDQPDASILTRLHIDPIRTHAFCLFTSTTAAARVRSLLHDRKWPNERDRKILWVDYIPEENVDAWIRREEDDPNRRMKRWEVVYEPVGEGEVEARLEEEGVAGGAGGMAGTGNTMKTSLRQPSGHAAPALSPSKPSTPPPAVVAAAAAPASQSFLTLDQLFSSTTAKPKLYFLSVEKELVDRRLDILNRGRGSAGAAPRLDEKRRYTFEDGDLLVDNGPEFGLRAGGTLGSRDDPGGRGGHRVRGRGRPRRYS